MKTVKRTIAVILFIVMLVVIGYLVFTGSRITTHSFDIEDYKNTSFISSDRQVNLSIDENSSVFYTENGESTLIIFASNKDGVLKFSTETIDYKFILLSDENLYDLQTEKILYRGL